MGLCATTDLKTSVVTPKAQQTSVPAPLAKTTTFDEPSGKICVVGATGKQGSAVVRALLAQKKFSVRAITRNPNGAKAQALALEGVDVVKADLNDAHSLVQAFKGCYGVFAVTNFWADMNPETEVKQARNMIKACEFNDVKHVLWSTLEDTTPVMALTNEEKRDGYYVAHFDVKEAIDAMWLDSGIPTTCVVTSFFYENWIESMPPTDYGHGYVIGMNMADSKLSMMALDDFGRVAALVFSKPSYQGQKIGFSSDELTGSEIAQIMSKYKKAAVGYYAMADEDVEKAIGFEMTNMMIYYRKGGETIRKIRKLENSAKLTKLTKFDAWMAANADRLPLKKAGGSQEDDRQTNKKEEEVLSATSSALQWQD